MVSFLCFVVLVTYIYIHTHTHICRYMKTKEGRQEPPFRMIDFSNVGTGRVAWEVLYFLQNSTKHNWENLEHNLKHYYNELLRFEPKADHEFPFEAFRMEYFLNLFLFLVHTLMKHFRSGTYFQSNKTDLEELISDDSVVGKKAKRDLNLVKSKMRNLLNAATDICNHCHEYDIISRPDAQ